MCARGVLAIQSAGTTVEGLIESATAIEATSSVRVSMRPQPENTPDPKYAVPVLAVSCNAVNPSVNAWLGIQDVRGTTVQRALSRSSYERDGSDHWRAD